MPSASVYVHRFGSLIRAYQMVGYTPDRDYRFLEINRFLRRTHPEIVEQIEKQIASLGGSVVRDPATDLLWVNREFSVSVVLARCQTTPCGHNRWKIRLDSSLSPDISVAARLDPSNQAQLDYYLPDGHFKLPHLWPLKLPQAGRVGLWVFHLPRLTILHEAGGLVEMASVAA